MNKVKLIPVVLMGILFAFMTSCEADPVESCEEDVICEDKTVTACCDEDGCYYEFNGKTYGDDADSLKELALALGCTNASLPTYEEDLEYMTNRLMVLHDLAAMKR